MDKTKVTMGFEQNDDRAKALVTYLQDDKDTLTGVFTTANLGYLDAGMGKPSDKFVWGAVVSGEVVLLGMNKTTYRKVRKQFGTAFDRCALTVTRDGAKGNTKTCYNVSLPENGLELVKNAALVTDEMVHDGLMEFAETLS